jgi:cell fate regulator YaaT (PSP1 superfamily)
MSSNEDKPEPQAGNAAETPAAPPADPPPPADAGEAEAAAAPAPAEDRAPENRPARKPQTRTYAALTLRPAGRVHWLPVDPRRFALSTGDLVVVETDRGLSMARVLIPAVEKERGDVDHSRHVRKMVRPAREPDLITHAEGKARESELLDEVKDITLHAGINVNVVSVDFQAIGNKLTVFFAAEKRVDFRSLVRELSHRLGVRVEMRQIGVRDEAKLFGAIGHCGRELCCATFLRGFGAVSIRMAKTQNLALSPNKVSGLCGRLMCCLAYEHECYHEMSRGLPKAGKRVLTDQGPGKVLSLDVLQQKFTFYGDDGKRQILGVDNLERDDEGRPIRPPPRGDGPPPPRGGRRPPAGRDGGGDRPRGRGGKPAGKPAGEPAGKPEGRPEGRPEGKPEGRPEGKPEGRPGNPDEKTAGQGGQRRRRRRPRKRGPGKPAAGPKKDSKE